MKILVTGAEGFIGSHLTELLVKNGYEVRAMVLYNSFNYRGWLENLDENILENVEIVMGDVRDSHNVLTLAEGCATIIHLAALIAIPYSYIAPDTYVDTNIKGTLNVLQAARQKNLRTLITSTSEVYGTAMYVPIDEKHPFQGQSPYSATKIGADRLAESFYRSFELPITIVRPFNTFGPRQSNRAVIPTIIAALCKGENLKLGNLTPTRDFNFVEDTANGFLHILREEKTIGEEINIATGQEISIQNLADELIRQINPAAKIICETERLRPQNSEVERLLGSNEKIRQLTGWSPQYSFEDGIAKTIEWFKNPTNLAHYKTNSYVV
ncbi:MAG: SDR family NAD(P)-dependent oxidoreductase [Firmicutes bacterium]|nr:SDR family NAD(P)-dependent oxidoreductase [Bacillota bacterium]